MMVASGRMTNFRNVEASGASLDLKLRSNRRIAGLELGADGAAVD
jgi:hypothetical protein